MWLDSDPVLFVLDLHMKYTVEVIPLCTYIAWFVIVWYVRSVSCVFAYLYTLDDNSERSMDYKTSLLPNVLLVYFWYHFIQVYFCDYFIQIYFCDYFIQIYFCDYFIQIYFCDYSIEVYFYDYFINVYLYDYFLQVYSATCVLRPLWWETTCHIRPF